MNKLGYFFHMKLYYFEIQKKEKVLSLSVQFFLKFFISIGLQCASFWCTALKRNSFNSFGSPKCWCGENGGDFSLIHCLNFSSSLGIVVAAIGIVQQWQQTQNQLLKGSYSVRKEPVRGHGCRLICSGNNERLEHQNILMTGGSSTRLK